MIQIRQLRKWVPKGQTKPATSERLIDPPVTAPSVAELFADLGKYLLQIHPDNRWNLYYTSHPCDTVSRKWAAPQLVLPFDIDGIDVEKYAEYHDPVLSALGVEWDTTGVVFSGNGLQYVVELKRPIESEDFFDKYRDHYKAVCAKINQNLRAQNLPGFADSAVFSVSRLLRLPGTENRKDGKTPRMARLLQECIEPVDFDLVKASGLPEVPDTEQVPREALKAFVVDSEAVKSGCEFLKWAKAEPTKVSEPQWFGLLSIVGRLANGNEEAHEYSKGHGSYSHSETDAKLQQALAASGPRTCKNVGSLWDGCHKCPHFEKINSPISIRGENFIATEGSGFHSRVTGANGRTVLRPNYEDLRRFFERDHTYKILGGSRICYVWTGKRYEELEDAYLENFAQRHFRPHATTDMVGEFRKLVQRTNLHSPDWFESTTNKKINFQNGVLDTETLELLPHSPDMGFRSVLNYTYDPTATSPAFDKFLAEVTCNDSGLEALLLEFAGYALSSDSCWAHKALVLDGHGSNGKSTFMGVLRALAGKGNYASLTLSDLRAEGNRQMLDGKLFNMAEETPSRSLMESSIFKNLVSGGETQVRQLYKNAYVMRNRAKLIFACNELPGSNDTSLGYFRRFLIVPFRATFSDAAGNKDPFIEEKLTRELPGIFNKVLVHYRTLMKNKRFTEGASTDSSLQEYRLAVDTTYSFFSEVTFTHRGLGYPSDAA